MNYSLYNYANCSNVLQIVRIMTNLDSAVLVAVSFARIVIIIFINNSKH